MRDKLREKAQRELTQMLRRNNKGIADDHLWNGRFIAKQIASNWERFDDNSGGVLVAIIRMYDKLTKQYKDYRLEHLCGYKKFTAGHLGWNIINPFITEDIAVWQNGKPNPYEDETDYNKIKIKNKDLQYDRKEGFVLYELHTRV